MRAGFLLLCAAALAQGQTYEGLFAEAESLAARGEFGGAAAQYEAALRMRPGAVEALSNLSVVYYWAGPVGRCGGSSCESLAR